MPLGHTNHHQAMNEIYLYILLGSGSGILAGMLGVGGGQIIVPSLIYIFLKNGVSIDYLMHMAIGTSLATIVFTSISAIYAHHKHGAVMWDVFRKFSPSILVGALFGALFADYLHGETLMMIFGAVLIILALQMMLNFKPKPSATLPSTQSLSVVGLVIGWISALVGIGGGSMSVPFLVWCNTSIRYAVATGAACGLPIAIAGMVGFIFMGWNESALPNWSTGYIYWPACLGIVSTSILTAPLGTKLAHTLPSAITRKIFSIILTIAGIKILFGAFA